MVKETFCLFLFKYSFHRVVTGSSQGYAFITFTNSNSCREAYKYAHETTLDDHVILVDYERSRLMKNWIPRRLGGGYGGKKESGQLRFGARDRPFRDTHGKLNIDYDQNKSDNWKFNTSKRSSKRDRSSERSQRSSERYYPEKKSTERRQRERYHRDRSSERPDKRRRDRSSDYHESSSERRSSEYRRRSPQYKRKRLDTQDRHR